MRPTTRHVPASDGSAVAAVMPTPIRSTSRMGYPREVNRLQAIMRDIRRPSAEEFANFEAARLQPDHRLGSDRRRQDAHMAGNGSLLRPDGNRQIVQGRSI